jgi:hypothetical protein
MPAPVAAPDDLDRNGRRPDPDRRGTSLAGAHPQLRLGVDASWPPFEFRDQEGRYQGLAADYIALIQERLGVTLKPVEPSSWTEVLEQARNNRIDLLPGIMSTPERQSYLAFTRPYLDFPIVILAHKGGAQPRSLKDLYGLKIAVVENYAPTSCCAPTTPTSTWWPCPTSARRCRRWPPTKWTPWSATLPPASGACASSSSTACTSAAKRPTATNWPWPCPAQKMLVGILDKVWPT